MKTEQLKEQGLTDEQISFVMKENGKDISKAQKEVENITADRDAWKAKAETAEETLKSFEGIDPKDLNKQIEDWKKKAEDAEKDFQKKIYERDFSDALKAELESVKFSSEAAKRDIMSQITAAELKLKDGKILGLNDLLGQLKESDASAFVDEAQERANQNAARFTTPIKNTGGGTSKSKEDILSIKDRSERQKAIAENISLFQQ